MKLPCNGGPTMRPNLISRRSKIADRSAFTLVEVLATLMLVGVVLPVVVRATGMSAQLGAWSDRQATAASLADAKLAELIVTGDWELGDDDGRFEADTYGRHADRFAWELTIDDWNSATFKQLTITVTWTSGSREKQVALSTVVPAPTTGGTL